ncbi:hypothetical protein M422DRAFT_32495 [Sphaerobolus stellatus SS14]|uniref:Unplaced genomic scaffold SPHSTscaffold_73, whole genome shotgun sequence n=1 Tax=Sphaerobolus stellatus (strain SS14) TaxID=990650 RepID=A0A0C9VP65_SPHS4|nr:hypothetical protein M422DRAFT_32495 [Sphaerobolus stellatus SS14]
MWSTFQQVTNGSPATSHHTVSAAPAMKRKSSATVLDQHGKSQRVTLTSKHNWWLIDVEEDNTPPPPPPPPRPSIDLTDRVPVDVSPPHFQAPAHPSSIFAHPTGSHSNTFTHQTHSLLHSVPSSTATSTFPAPSNPTARLLPFSSGSTSELFKCIVKKPAIVQLEINGEMQTNAPDVMLQFLAELRVYSTLKGHRNFPAYLGSLEGVGMVIELIEGRSLLDVLRETKTKDGGLSSSVKVKYWDQMVDGLTYLHSFGLSHGDLSLLNVLVTRTNTLKILDFGRSTSIESQFIPPSEPLPEPDVSVFAPSQPTPPPSYSQSRHHSYGFGYDSHRPTISRTTTQSNGHKHRSITLSLPSPSSSPPSSRPSTPRQEVKPKIEQIHPGTRPFTAPEILREECTDPILADAYSFGMMMFCVDLGGLVDIDQQKQRNGEVPDLRGCEMFGDRLEMFLADVWERKRIGREDFMERTP